MVKYDDKYFIKFTFCEINFGLFSTKFNVLLIKERYNSENFSFKIDISFIDENIYMHKLNAIFGFYGVIKSIKSIISFNNF